MPSPNELTHPGSCELFAASTSWPPAPAVISIGNSAWTLLPPNFLLFRLLADSQQVPDLLGQLFFINCNRALTDRISLSLVLTSHLWAKKECLW